MRPMDGSPNGNTENGAAGTKIYRASSYEFWSKEHAVNGRSEGSSSVPEFDFRNPGVEDPPSKLIGQFLHKQQASGDFSLDMDLEMRELKEDNVAVGLPPLAESPLKKALPKENKSKVSFEKQTVSSDEVRIQKDSSSSSSPAKELDPQVVRCTSIASLQSNSSFRRRSRLQVSPKNTTINNTTRSRLLDPPEERKQTEKSPKSAQSRSGLLGKHAEEEEDDLFLDDDLPEHYKKDGISWIVVIEWVSLIVIIGALVCSLTIKSVKSHLVWKLELWKWEVMVLVLICGRLVSSWGIRIVVFLIERNFLLRKRVLYFVYGLRRAVVNCLWLGLVLLAWHFLLDKKVQRETNSRALEHVTKVLVCLLVGTIVWLVKTLIVKVLASSFHVSTYFDRIQEALFNQFVIKTLTGPPLIEMRNLKEEDDQINIEIENLQNAGAAVPPGFSEAVLNSNKSPRCVGSGRMEKKETCKGENEIMIDHLHRLTPSNVSAWNMKRLVNVVRHGKLMTLDEQLSNHDNDHDESGNKINSEDEAKAAAKKIFRNVAAPGSKYIYLEDLMRFMPEHEALKTMSLFEEASESQKISKSSLKNWAVNVFRERRALALTLDDTKTAVNQLHRMVNVIIGIIIFIVWLLILGIASGKFLLVISSQLLLVAFIFGNSCKTTFEAIIFLFVMHPFDVGDRCEIDGVQMIVEEMNILTTVFLRYDNQKIIFPNSALATKPISNYRRSPDMGDAVEFCVHISTPTEKIAAMKQRITSYIEKKNEHWEPAPMIIYKEVEDLNKIRLAIWPKHRMNHHDMGERWTRRALLVEELVKIFKELDMQYRLFPLDINVRAMPLAPPNNGLPPFWTAPSSN